MQKLSKLLSVILLAAFLSTFSGLILNPAYAGVGNITRIPIKSCPACQDIANQLSEAIYDVQVLKQILKNLEYRKASLTRRHGSLDSLGNKYRNAKRQGMPQGLIDRLGKQIDQMRSLDSKIKSTKAKLSQKISLRQRLRTRLTMCEQKKCKGKQNKPAVGLGGFIRGVSGGGAAGVPSAKIKTCPPCQPIANKLESAIEGIEKQKRRLKDMRYRLDNLESRYGTEEELDAKYKEMGDKVHRRNSYLAGKGINPKTDSLAKSLNKQWNDVSNRRWQANTLKKNIKASEDYLKILEEKAKKLEKELRDCEKEHCPDRSHGQLFIPSDEQYANVSDGAYAGLGAGFNKSTTRLRTDEPSVMLVEDEYDNSDGVKGVVFVGYQMVRGQFYLAAEVVGKVNSLSKKTIVSGPQTITKMGIENSVGINVIPGLIVTPRTIIFVKVGGASGKFKVETATGTDFNQRIGGVLFGTGIAFMITKNIGMRGEFNYTTYEKVRRTVAALGGLIERYEPDTYQGEVQVVYHFG